jgi:hypothetical protein
MPTIDPQSRTASHGDRFRDFPTAAAPFIGDPDTAMPEHVQRHHHALNVAACRAYQLRNDATDTGRAAFYHGVGDTFLSRALALSEEWDA